jgi:type II secretory ATPase GspE/PulE/Tfp pilus assembly ATPase PilB-like protein
MRTLPHIKQLDDCFSQFLVRITCQSCKTWREVTPESLARIAGWSATFEALTRRMRCSKCGMKAAEIVAVPVPRPRGVQKNPH